MERRTVFAAAQPIPTLPTGGPPEWIMLFPAGAINTVDGRGPYRVSDLDALAAASLAAGERLPIDQDHATDLAAPNGGPAPARGWIVELAARDGALWGRVEWTGTGRELLTERAYRHISPAFLHGADGEVSRLLRASLTNNPNLRGLAALNQEGRMDLKQALCEALGLKEDADEAAIVAAVKALKGKSMNAALAPIAKAAGVAVDTEPAALAAAVAKLGDGTALAAALPPIAVAAGCDKGADAKTVLAAVETLAANASAETKAVAALKAELASVASDLGTLRAAMAKERAEAVVDAAIKAGKVIVGTLRDHYITRHAADPAGVERELASFPTLGPSGALETAPKTAADGTPSLNANQRAAAEALGVPAADYAKTLAAERAQEELA
jgi:phage I-like protein